MTDGLTVTSLGWYVTGVEVKSRSEKDDDVVDASKKAG